MKPPYPFKIHIASVKAILSYNPTFNIHEKVNHLTLLLNIKKNQH